MQVREEILAKDMEKDRSGLLIKVVEYRGIFFFYLFVLIADIPAHF